MFLWKGFQEFHIIVQLPWFQLLHELPHFCFVFAEDQAKKNQKVICQYRDNDN